MISPDVLKKGLAALAEGYSRKIDQTTEAVWRHALRELNDAQFRFGVDAVLRDPSIRFFPPPAVVRAAGFDMPRDNDVPPRFQLSEAPDYPDLLQVVRDSPISGRETGTMYGALHYIRRLAISAGLMPEDGQPSKTFRGAR
jgi:hypothetical protein